MALGEDEQVIEILGSHTDFTQRSENRIRSRRLQKRSHLLNAKVPQKYRAIALSRSWIGNRGGHRSHAQPSTPQSDVA
jgi:hypothetical protein